jgi:hypothetical protein
MGENKEEDGMIHRKVITYFAKGTELHSRRWKS